MSNISRRIDTLNKVLNSSALAKEAYREFVRRTPVRSGNARNSTRLNGNEIQADYPYAGRLDHGYSRQAPTGMSKPTIVYIQNYIKKQLGK